MFVSVSEGWKPGAGSWYPSPVSDTPSRALTSDSRIAIAPDQVSCDLAGETAIVNLRNGVYYGLDTVGTHVWNRLGQTMTFGELCDSLLREYDVDESRLEDDMRTFLRALSEQGLIEIT